MEKNEKNEWSNTAATRRILSQRMTDTENTQTQGVTIDINDRKNISSFEKSTSLKEIDKGTQYLFGTISSKIPGFDKIQLPKYDVNFLGSRLSAINLVVRYLVDFFVIIPWFIIYNTYEGTFRIIKMCSEKKYKNAVIYFFLYSLDSLLPMSYIFLFFIMMSIDNDVLYNWVASCFILFCSFLLLVVFYSLAYEQFGGWKDFFTFSHLDTLGLGMCRRVFEDRNPDKAEEFKKTKSFIQRASIQNKLAAKTKDLAEFQKSLKAIFETLTIDDTFFYYSYFFDDLNKNNTCTKKDVELNELFAREMVFVHHKGEHLLFRMNENSLEIEERMQEIKLSTILIFLLLIFFKIVVPYIFLFEELNEQDIDGFSVFAITLFYIFIMAVLFPLLSHEDLKRRTFILESLNLLVAFQQDSTLDEENIAAYEGNSPTRKAKKDALLQLKLSGTENATTELQLKMDVTCLISLQTWDNCRRAAVLMDQKRSERFEIIYIFLGIYAFFILLVLLQVLFQVYLLFSSSSPLNSSLIVTIFTIDFTIMLVLFFHRIYFGSTFNNCFTKHKDSLDKLTYIYQDFLNMFEVYYNYCNSPESQKPINNKIYDAIFARLLAKYDTVKDRYDDFNRKEEGKLYLKNYIRKLSEAANRIKSQLSFDENHYQHRFLGILTSDFQMILAEVCIVLVPILPTLLSNIFGH